MDAGDTLNVAALVLYTSDDKFILQRRTKDAPTFPGMLCLFGGHIKSGEKPAEAAVREYHEELSVNLPQLAYIGILRGYVHPEVSNKPMDVSIYAAMLNEQHFSVYEGEGAEWISFVDVSELSDIVSDSRDALELFLKEKTSGTIDN